MLRHITFLLILSSTLFAKEISDANRRALFMSLDPKSVKEHFAFYRLFEETPEGRRALREAWSLLTHESPQNLDLPTLSPELVEELIHLVNKPPGNSCPLLAKSDLLTIEELGKGLKNRTLRGHSCQTEAEYLPLPTEEIDLARALLLSQSGDDLQMTRTYEALFDLMAIQVQARLPKNPTPRQIIDALSQFIFDEMHYRFPPLSSFTEDIDLYTFIPSVIDSRRGVCLGVSILYLCLSQRLGLPLKIVTPPGHIFVRYEDETQVINIETTARGIDIPDEHYLSLNTKALEMRQMKEVVGMAYMNQAALFWSNKNFEKAVETYLQALKTMPGDPLLTEFLAYNYLFLDETDKGKELLEQIKDFTPDHQVVRSKLAQEYLEGLCDEEAILAIFTSVDKDRASIEKKRAEIEESLERFPQFASGWFHLAVTHLQLHRYHEALEALMRAHELDKEDPTTEYYLAALYTERLDLPKAWHHYRIASKLTEAAGHHPRALRELKAALLTSLVND